DKIPQISFFDSSASGGLSEKGSGQAVETAAEGREAAGTSADADPDAVRDRQRRTATLEQEQDQPGQPAARTPTATDLESLFEKNFARLDTDRDGFVSRQELAAAIASSEFKGDDAGLVAVLQSHRQELEELSNDEWGDEDDGITRADMRKFAQLLSQPEASGSERRLIDAINRELRDSWTSVSCANRQLFAEASDPLTSITPEAVRQGEIGDCYFLGALAALAATAPGKEAIRAMIKDNGDGTYTVTFPGAPDKPVTVTAPTDAELSRYARGSRHGTWPAVLEKAYGKYCNENNIDPHDGIQEGGDEKTGLEILTGGEVDRDILLFTSKETTHQKLVEAVSDGRPVTAGIYSEVGEPLGLSDGKTDNAGLPTAHLYTIQSYNPATRTLTIRNPWGKGEPTCGDGDNDGVFTMTLDEFYKNFSTVAYVEPKRS
ncbi:MAG TPA: C2 family cysteine protease, partial [Candidatus Obscuribacterales bacterium]